MLALGFSFLCSIAEAVLLSIPPSYITLLEEQGRRKLALRLKKLKDDINAPLAAILTLNTIAHTVGAAGSGAQAASVFGSDFVGLISVVLTLLILVFSEIIPKTIGAHYWRELAPMTSLALKNMVIVFYPFVKLSALITRHLSNGPSLKGFNREEFAAMAELSSQEGLLLDQEKLIIKNLFRFHKVPVKRITTPRTVVFYVKASLSIQEFFEKYKAEKFSRIPLYEDSPENMVGFVLRTDLLDAMVHGHLNQPLKSLMRPIRALPETLNISQTFERFLRTREQIVTIIDEHGGFEGIVTLEDIFENLLGTDIIDESDKAPNMQMLARKIWKRRQKKLRQQEQDR